MTNFNSEDVSAAGHCPTPATEALKLFMTQHAQNCAKHERLESETSHSSKEDTSSAPLSPPDPLDMVDLSRETAYIERAIYGASTDDGFPAIEWKSEDENDDNDGDENPVVGRRRETTPAPTRRNRNRLIRKPRKYFNSDESCASSSSFGSIDGNSTTMRKRRSGDALDTTASCVLQRCKSRKMCLPGCLGQCSSTTSTSYPSNASDSPLPGQNQPAVDIDTLSATLRRVTSEEYSILQPPPTSWGHFVPGSESRSLSTPSSPKLSRMISSRARGMHVVPLRKTGSSGCFSTSSRSSAAAAAQRKNNSFCYSSNDLTSSTRATYTLAISGISFKSE